MVKQPKWWAGKWIEGIYGNSFSRYSPKKSRIVYKVAFSRMGHTVAQSIEALCCKPEGCRFDLWLCHWNFSLTWSFWLPCVPWVNSASNRNEYQEYFLGGKGGWCTGLTTLPLTSTDCLEIWEPYHSGTFRVCPGLYTGIAASPKQLTQ